MKNILFNSSLLLLSVTLLTACGSDGGGGSDSSPHNQNTALQEQEAEGSYTAILRPMNNTLMGFLPTGKAEFDIQGDSVQIKTYLDDGARVTHLQSVHTGTRCPNISDDLNGDGIIDIEEAYRAVGDIFIPLDGDVNSLDGGAGQYPMGGGFTYTKSASLSSVTKELSARFNQNLNLAGRVVLVHGVNSGTQIPTSVATRDGLTPQASVPVTCGIIKRK